MSDQTSLPNPFDSLLNLSTRTRKVKLADPQDMQRSVPKWSAAQLAINNVDDRGRPEDGFEIHINPGAPTFEFEIQRLPSLIKEACVQIMNTEFPPEIIVEEPGIRGEPGNRVRTGWEWQDPAYQAKQAKLQMKQSAMVVLYGIVGLRDVTEGSDDEAKIALLRSKLDDKLITYLASEIWNLSYSAGDPADFFTSANS